MKCLTLRTLAVLFCMTLLLAVDASAQSTRVPPIAPAKVAVVYSSVFADQKLGISKFLAVQKTIQQEFKQTQDELLKLGNQLDALEKELRSTSQASPDQGAVGDKAEQFDRLKREFGFRSSEANTAIGKRFDQLMKPVSDEVSKALQEFAKKNSIDIVIDASKTGGVYVFSNAVDVTSQFVAYFNAQPASK